MPDYPPLPPQVVGQAESALSALLAPLLAGAKLTTAQWFVLATAATRPGAFSRTELVAAVAASRKANPDDIAAVVAELTEAGALAPGDPVTLTPAGQTRVAGVQDRLTGYAGALFDFPAADLATAGRVLGIMTARANALLEHAGPVAGDRGSAPAAPTR
ncbi:MAG TPA: hypothetical protein VHF26_14550 [Trebonia sp.]|nr:hypothetical protein [Trebonia sp.]